MTTRINIRWTVATLLTIWAGSIFLVTPTSAAAHSMALRPTPTDTDGDGLSDTDEVSLYHLDPHNPDTDGDGYSDGEELNNGYSPLVAGPAGKLYSADYDKDGLTDGLEYKFHTDPTNPDTDGDGYPDGVEVNNAYDPNNKNDVTAKLKKKIIIDTKTQRLQKVLGTVTLAKFKVSTGKRSMPTPKGTFSILEKRPRAWSKAYSLWMPYFMLFTKNGAGIHELPEWPNGYKEGANHLGVAVSHGCVRLGVGPAKELYDWAQIGTTVVVL